MAQDRRAAVWYFLLPWGSFVFLFTLHVSRAAVLMAAGMDTMQSSTLNGEVSGLGVDGDTTTCAASGYDNSPWWKVDLWVPRDVTGVTVTGKSTILPPSITIRVGNLTGHLRSRDEHLMNVVCASWREGLAAVGTAHGQTFQCDAPLNGRYVSVETGTEGAPSSLVLCEVKVHGN